MPIRIQSNGKAGKEPVGTPNNRISKDTSNSIRKNKKIPRAARPAALRNLPKDILVTISAKKSPTAQETNTLAKPVKHPAASPAVQPYSAGKTKVGAIKLSSNESPFPPSSRVRRAIMQSLRSAQVYPGELYARLTQAIVNRHGLERERVLLANGSGEALYFLSSRIIERGSEALMSSHTFSLYAIAAQLAGARVRATPPTEDGLHDLDHMLRAITDKTSVVFVCNPNNPTGCAHDAKTMLAFLRSLPKSVCAVLDEAYMDFADARYKTEAREIFKAHEKTVVLRTFSKFFALGGLRLGYALSDPRIIASLNQARPPFNVNCAAAAAGIASLQHYEHYERKRHIIISEREQMASAMRAAGIRAFASQANFLCVDASSLTAFADGHGEQTEKLADRLFDEFAAHNLMIRSLVSFGMDNHVRITIGLPRHNRRVLSLLKKLRQKFKGTNVA